MRTDLADEPIRLARFKEGRDLAVAMLRQTSDIYLLDRAAIEARDRGDPTKPQHRWTAPFLAELQRNPDLLDGFSAVLSDCLASGSIGTPDYYAGITLDMLTELRDVGR